MFAQTRDYEQCLKHSVILKENNKLIEKTEQMLVSTLYKLGLIDEALMVIDASNCRVPEAGRMRWKGILLTKLERHDEAEKFAKKAVELDPDSALTRSNLAIIQWDQDKTEEAIENSMLAMEMNAKKSKSIDVMSNMASIYMDIGEYKKSEEIAKKIIEIEPDNPNANFLRSIILMRNKDYLNGWTFYSKRERVQWKYLSNLAEYKGEKEGRLLIVAEQGLGDEITFASIIKELKKTSLVITLQCDERLAVLFKRSFGESIEIRNRGQEMNVDSQDYWIYAGDLMQYFRKRIEDFQNSSMGYLEVDRERTDGIRRYLENEAKGNRIIGISWKSKTKRHLNRRNSYRLIELIGTFKNMPITYVNLQYGDVKEEIEECRKKGFDIIEYTAVDNMNDIDGLASLCKACDEVVTMPNVTVGLTGAIGVKTHLIVPYGGPRWRWGDEGKVGHVFDSVYVYRQQSVKENKEIQLAKIKKVLYTKIKEGPSHGN